MSTIRCPIGSWIGSPAPIAAASASSTRVTCFPPLEVTASSTARFSTSELSEGMQIRTRGLGKRPGATRRSTEPRYRRVISNSVTVPSRNGRTATTLPESPPIRSQAASPIATTEPVDAWSATTVGSSKTIPSPSRYTIVFAVPRSIARSRPIRPPSPSGLHRSRGAPSSRWGPRASAVRSPRGMPRRPPRDERRKRPPRR